MERPHSCRGCGRPAWNVPISPSFALGSCELLATSLVCHSALQLKTWGIWFKFLGRYIYPHAVAKCLDSTCSQLLPFQRREIWCDVGNMFHPQDIQGNCVWSSLFLLCDCCADSSSVGPLDEPAVCSAYVMVRRAALPPEQSKVLCQSHGP